MRVAIIGGTGKMGRALGRHLAKNHDVIIGSRDKARAVEAAKGVKGAVGEDYHGAARNAEAVVLSIPYSAVGTMAALADDLAGKLVISLINPTKAEGGLLEFSLERGSAAEELAKILPRSHVATAFNNVPPAFLDKDEALAADILVAADSKETYEKTAAMVRGVGQMRPLYAGPLSQAGVVERITPLLVNLAKLNQTGSLTTRFVSRKRLTAS